VRFELKLATADDVGDLVSLHSSVSQRLTSLFGKGHWSTSVTERGVLFAMRISKIFVFRSRRKLIAALTLSTRKPFIPIAEGTRVQVDRNVLGLSKSQANLFKALQFALRPLCFRRGVGNIELGDFRVRRFARVGQVEADCTAACINQGHSLVSESDRKSIPTNNL
jgi:hypothetical protein